MKQFCDFLNKFIKSARLSFIWTFIAKLYGYDFDMTPLKSIYTYQKAKETGNSRST